MSTTDRTTVPAPSIGVGESVDTHRYFRKIADSIHIINTGQRYLCSCFFMISSLPNHDELNLEFQSKSP